MLLRFLANLISIIFHPLFMVIYTCLLLLYIYDLLPLRDLNYQYLLLSVLLFFSFVLPSFFILIMYRLKLITDLQLSNRSERVMPYFFTAIFYAFVAYLLYNKNFIDPLIYNILFFGSIVILVTAIINLKFKISSHAISCAVVLGMLLHLSFNYNDWNQLMALNLVIIVTGLVSSARLYLKAHDSFEIITGLAVGMVLGISAPFFIL